MQITVVVVVCHALAGISSPVCREEIVARTDAIQACMIGQPAIADWKSHSIYSGPQWNIARIKCVLGSYELRDAI